MRIATDFSFAVRTKQIGMRVDLQGLDTRLQKFLSSQAGTDFILHSVEILTGRRWPSVESVTAAVFQQGVFQFVFKVEVENGLGEREKFCLILSKGTEKLMTDRLTIEDYNNLRKYHLRCPELVVEPLVLAQDTQSGLVLYSSRLYESHLEVGYKIDGLGGQEWVASQQF